MTNDECGMCLSEGVHETAVRECDQCGFRVGACSAHNWKCPRHFGPGGSCDGELVAIASAPTDEQREQRALAAWNGE